MFEVSSFVATRKGDVYRGALIIPQGNARKTLLVRAWKPAKHEAKSSTWEAGLPDQRTKYLEVRTERVNAGYVAVEHVTTCSLADLLTDSKLGWLFTELKANGAVYRDDRRKLHDALRSQEMRLDSPDREALEALAGRLLSAPTPASEDWLDDRPAQEWVPVENPVTNTVEFKTVEPIAPEMAIVGWGEWA